jgi:multidrug efflux system membrane fusion protein
MVHKGDLLAQIDPRPNQAAYEQALATKAKDAAQLANAKRDLDRYTCCSRRTWPASKPSTRSARWSIS